MVVRLHEILWEVDDIATEKWFHYEQLTGLHLFFLSIVVQIPKLLILWLPD